MECGGCVICDRRKFCHLSRDGYHTVTAQDYSQRAESAQATMMFPGSAQKERSKERNG